MVETRLSVVDVFTGVISMYRKLFGFLVLAAIVVFFTAAFLAGVVLVALLSRSLPLLLGSLFLLLVAAVWYNALVVAAVGQVRAGSPSVTLATVMTRVSRRLGAVLGASILAGLGVIVGFLLLTIPGRYLMTVLSLRGPVSVIVGFLLLIPGLYLMTVWSLLGPVIVIEGRSVLGAFGRSQRLISGNGLVVFGVLVLLLISILVISVVLDAALGEAGIGVGFVANVVVMPAYALATSVMYFRLVEIKEPRSEFPRHE